MKNVVKIFLLGIILYNFMGYYIVFVALRGEAKEEMREEINNASYESNIILIRLPYKEGNVQDKDFELLDEDEFSYKGNMYDITKAEIEDGYINFYCLSDNKEDELNLAVVKHIRDNVNESGGVNKKESGLKKVPLKKFTGPGQNFSLTAKQHKALIYMINYIKIPSAVIDIASPPPRFI